MELLVLRVEQKQWASERRGSKRQEKMIDYILYVMDVKELGHAIVTTC